VSTPFLVNQVLAGETTVTITNSSVFTAARIRIGKSSDCLTVPAGEFADVVGITIPGMGDRKEGRGGR
jgi:hypothetical protein